MRQFLATNWAEVGINSTADSNPIKEMSAPLLAKISAATLPGIPASFDSLWLLRGLSIVPIFTRERGNDVRFWECVDGSQPFLVTSVNIQPPGQHFQHRRRRVPKLCGMGA